jgi:hypothetical protein
MKAEKFGPLLAHWSAAKSFASNDYFLLLILSSSTSGFGLVTCSWVCFIYLNPCLQAEIIRSLCFLAKHSELLIILSALST